METLAHHHILPSQALLNPLQCGWMPNPPPTTETAVLQVTLVTKPSGRCCLHSLSPCCPFPAPCNMEEMPAGSRDSSGLHFFWLLESGPQLPACEFCDRCLCSMFTVSFPGAGGGQLERPVTLCK